MTEYARGNRSPLHKSGGHHYSSLTTAESGGCSTDLWRVDFNELVRQYKDRIRLGEQHQQELPSDSPDRLRVYVQEILPYRMLLRELYESHSVPVCCASSACTEHGFVRCAAGKHPSCTSHARSCAACLRHCTS